ncbi:Crp/Fnr family transcriptional regulator [Paracraurococcus lichenis]|uniref:Crp/Fnr family transcriptional regulator n=1 Tax=Paracraurococcus lichenis TaxID=3064888 RepID=A0ABT9E555_9PROT|nr:Crp/Fnr family transcriptional regulator [Paracraurococcus sp. LOR1-02]MDO9711271.1 Crp/Fnr family transcriptional regulator [Paracraurococcus sp. LOR1-02]
MVQGPEDERLSRFPMLREVDAVLLAEAARHARWRRVQPGEAVIDYEDSSDDVFLIISGTVRVAVHSASGQEVILGELGPGETIGEMSAIDGANRSANVTAVHNSLLCCLPRTAFLDLVLKAPSAGLQLLRLLTQRLRLLDARNVEMAVLPVRFRLLAELLRLGRPREDGQLRISPPPPQHVLAARIGARREAVSRELSALAREGLATVSRQSILLPNPDLLREQLRRAMGGDTGKGRKKT